MERKIEKLPDPYWWFFSTNVEDWHTNNHQRDCKRWSKVWRDKQERKYLRDGKFARI